MARIGGASIDEAAGGKKGGSKREKKKDARQAAADDILRLVAMCVAKDLAPLIVFSFGKREVESNAEAVLPLDLTTGGQGEGGSGAPALQGRAPALQRALGTGCCLLPSDADGTLARPLDSPDEEKAMVETTFRAAIDSLSPEDRQLKQVGAWGGCRADCCAGCTESRCANPARKP